MLDEVVQRRAVLPGKVCGVRHDGSVWRGVGRVDEGRLSLKVQVDIESKVAICWSNDRSTRFTKPCGVSGLYGVE